MCIDIYLREWRSERHRRRRRDKTFGCCTTSMHCVKFVCVTLTRRGVRRCRRQWNNFSANAFRSIIESTILYNVRFIDVVAVDQVGEAILRQRLIAVTTDSDQKVYGSLCQFF